MTKNNIPILITVFTLMFFTEGFSQANRSTNNKGVDQYDEQKYSDAEVNFRKFVENSPKNFEANFNLGDSYYKQKKYDDAIKSYTGALESAGNDNSKAKVYHNIGNSLLKSNKVEQAVESYKNAQKYNPDDADTKYNLSYALELLKNKDKNQQQNKNDQNKNDKNKDNKQNQQNQNKDQQNKDQNKQNQNQNPQPKDQEAKQDNTKQPQKQKENQISKEEAERILDALKNNEKDLQKKLRKKVGRVRPTDKDW